MINRNNIFNALCLTTVGSLLGHAVFADTVPKKPNVLFIAIDDLRPQLHCYGYKQMVTPNFDRVAEHGVVFTNHYVQMAVSIPSRVCLMTGIRPETSRQLFGQLIYQKTTPGAITMGEYFHDHGYYTAYRGKIIHGEYPEGRLRLGLDEPTYAPDWTDSYVEEENRNLWDYGPKKLRPCTECSDKPDSLFIDGIIVKRALKTMENCAKAGKPFFLAVGFHKPHTPFSAPKRFWDLYKREDIDLAPNDYFPKDMPLEAFNGWADMGNYRETPDPGAMHRAVKNGTDFPVMCADNARLLKHAYYACVSWTDYNIGLLLDKLKELGVEDNTIIVLWGDHGYHLGEHLMWSKSSNFDIATRSPLIISVPQMRYKGIRQDELVETVDVFPTLTELCGLPAPEVSEGCSMVPLLENPDIEWKKAVFSMYFRGPENNRIIGFSMRTKKYRYTEWVKGWKQEYPTSRKDYTVISRELYDYETDPGENVNVANLKSNKKLIKKLADRLYKGYKAAGPKGWTAYSFSESLKSNDYTPLWYNIGFEVGSPGTWETSSKDVRPSISFVEYRTGGHSLQVLNRQNENLSLVNPLSLEPNTNYKLQVWMKSDKGEAQASVKLRSINAESSGSMLVDTKKINSDTWVLLEGPIRITKEFSEGEMSVVVETSGKEDFYIDDFSIVEL